MLLHLRLKYKKSSTNLITFQIQLKDGSRYRLFGQTWYLSSQEVILQSKCHKKPKSLRALINNGSKSWNVQTNKKMSFNVVRMISLRTLLTHFKKVLNSVKEDLSITWVVKEESSHVSISVPMPICLKSCLLVQTQMLFRMISRSFSMQSIVSHLMKRIVD